MTVGYCGNPGLLSGVAGRPAKGLGGCMWRGQRKGWSLPRKFAMCAGEAKKLREKLAAEAEERKKEHAGTAPGKPANTPGKFTGSVSGDTRDQLGKLFGVSGKMVDYADGRQRNKFLPQ